MNGKKVVAPDELLYHRTQLVGLSHIALDFNTSSLLCRQLRSLRMKREYPWAFNPGVRVPGTMASLPLAEAASLQWVPADAEELDAVKVTVWESDRERQGAMLF